MILIDGKKISAELREELKQEVADLKIKHNKVPGLTVILIGDMAPSQIYVRNKEKSANEVGLKSEVIRYPDTIEEKIVLEKITELNKDDLSSDDIIDWISKEAESVYKARESLVPPEVIRGFERFVILRTIDEKWKDHLYAMDQLREGINLRAYGQKNPLLEYKSEGFGMFQEMMKDMNAVTAQRIFRTQLQGMEQAPAISSGGVKNVKVEHQDTTGMGFAGQPQGQPNTSQQRKAAPVVADKKIGRNEKIYVQSPQGDKIQIKYKKLQQYLNQGYTQV